ncbi:MAG: hypothetical protein HKN37_17375 [Rhodothermales bacterium]|nr:hypothetical protein [Rhodothermales bacterium]
MVRARFFVCLFLFAVAAPPVVGQSIYEVSTGVRRDISRYRWLGSAVVKDRVGSWTIDAENRFVSDAYILFNEQLSTRDENHLSWSVTGPLHPRWNLTAEGGLGWFSLSRVFSSSGLVGMRYAATPTFWLEPRLGVAVDSRPGAAVGAMPAPLRTDSGPAYGFGASLKSRPAEKWQFRADGLGSWRMITPRRARDVRIDAMTSRSTAQTQFRSEFYLSSARRDAYEAVSFLNRTEPGAASESVEATRSDTLLLAARLSTPLTRRLRISSAVRLGANRRAVRTHRAPEESLFFETDFDRRTLDVDVDLAYTSERIDATIGVRGGAQNEERTLSNREELSPAQATQKTDLLRQADFDRGLLEAHGRANLTPLQFMTLHLDGSASILRHDTPEVNPDDRDEQFLTGRVGIELRLSQHLRTDVSLYGSRYATIYLKAIRSAENNVQRAVRLRPSVVWSPSLRTSIRVTSEVRATYTVDDFVLAGRQARDQSARELRYESEIEHGLGDRLRLVARGTYSDLRLGRFLDEAFAEIPFDTLRTTSGWIRIHSDGRVKASAGIRMFVRSDYNRTTTVRYSSSGESDRQSSITRPGRQKISQIGPTATISWPLGRRSSLTFEGWFVVQRITQTLYGVLPEEQVDNIVSAANKGVRTVIPNLSLTSVWRF